MLKKIALLIILSLFLSPAFASTSLDSVTTAGSGTISEGLTYNGSPVEAPKAGEGKFGWNVGYTFSKQTQSATSSSPEITDNTSDFTAGVSYKNGWEVGGGLSYSTTPAESLHSFGPNLFAGYLFELHTSEPNDQPKTPDASPKPTPQKSSKGFQPSIEVKAGFSSTTYTEDLSATTARTGAKKVAVGTRKTSEGITQTAFSPEVIASLLEWVSVRATYTHYKYNKDVKAFLALLDSPRAVQIGAANFGSTLSGFPSSTFELGATFYFLDVWNFTPSYTWSKYASDGSTGNSLKLALNREIGDHWSVGLGFEHDKSNGSLQNLGILSLDYDF